MATSSHRRHVLLALSWYDHEINMGVGLYAREAGWILIDKIGLSSTSARHARFDGVITLLSRGADPAFLRPYRVPIVDLAWEHPEFDIARVLPDNHAIGRIAAEHLAATGLEHLAFFNLADSHVERERMEGFRKAVVSAGRQFHVIDFVHQPKKLDFNRDAIPWLAEQLRSLPRPLGVMGQHDREAQLVIEAAEIAGLSVPDDVAVVGVDNDVLCCELGVVPLSSVERHRRDQGYQAAALLDRLMKGAARPKAPVRIPPGPIIPRRSSDLLMVNNPNLARAVRYIAREFANPNLSVEDVVEASGASRRTLYKLFEDQLGRPIHAEIARRRIERARQLLLAGGTKISSIAAAAGFHDPQHLTRAFRRELSTTPLRLRQQLVKRMHL